jgi:hypothetical protein
MWEVQKANEYMKQCSPSLAINEMQIKMTLTFHLTPIRMAIIKKTNNKCGWWFGNTEPSLTANENVNKYNHYGNQYRDSQKKLAIELSYDSAVPLLGILLKECKSTYNRHTCTCILTEHNSQ